MRARSVAAHPVRNLDRLEMHVVETVVAHLRARPMRSLRSSAAEPVMRRADAVGEIGQALPRDAGRPRRRRAAMRSAAAVTAARSDGGDRGRARPRGHVPAHAPEHDEGHTASTARASYVAQPGTAAALLHVGEPTAGRIQRQHDDDPDLVHGGKRLAERARSATNGRATAAAPSAGQAIAIATSGSGTGAGRSRSNGTRPKTATRAAQGPSGRSIHASSRARGRASSPGTAARADTSRS